MEGGEGEGLIVRSGFSPSAWGRCLLALEAWTLRAALITAEEEEVEDDGGEEDAPRAGVLERAAAACGGDVECSKVKPEDVNGRLDGVGRDGRGERTGSATMHELLDSSDEDEGGRSRKKRKKTKKKRRKEGGKDKKRLKKAR